MQYLYRDGQDLMLMDLKTYEQQAVDAAFVGEQSRFLLEGMKLVAQKFSGRIIGIELPKSITLKVLKTEPAVRGDTSKSALKQAELENGANVSVPLFIEPGNAIKVDTRNGQYLERA